MPVYTYGQMARYNLSNLSTCIPAEDYIQSLQYIVLKSEAERLAIYCFVAGIILATVIYELKARWNK
jgi:hypothetical protein